MAHTLFPFKHSPLLSLTNKCYLFHSSSFLLSISPLLVSPQSLSLPFLMVPELEKPRVTEIHVRMDCNGCVQKIKRALHGINGIYDLYIDFPQQKLTTIGWADPETMVKAIRKTRKIATICSHSEPTTEQPPAAPPTEQPPPEGGAPPPAADAAANPPPPEEAAPPPAEPPKDPPPQPENPPPDEKPSPSATETNSKPPSGPKDVGEVHVIYHHPPPEYGYRYGYGHNYGGGQWSRYPTVQGIIPPQEPPQPQPQPQPQRQPQPIYVAHSYNTYRPSPYVTEYQYIQPPPQPTHYSRMDHYNEDYHDTNSNGNGTIDSMFSDENPNACRIV